jgi:hypothetical protein
MLPLGASTVALTSRLRTSSIVMPIAASLSGSTCTRTEGFCWPPISTWATPAICEICCDSTFSA